MVNAEFGDYIKFYGGQSVRAVRGFAIHSRHIQNRDQENFIDSTATQLTADIDRYKCIRTSNSKPEADMQMRQCRDMKACFQ